MMIKDFLPFRYSREGYIPDRIVIRACEEDAKECRDVLCETKKAAHYHLSEEGCVTVLSPLSAGANLLGPTGSDPSPNSNEVPTARRSILILAETKNGQLTQHQREALIVLLLAVQKEVLRIYGERFDFRCDALIADPRMLDRTEILERAVLSRGETKRFRVQTGRYRNRKDAEEKIALLTQAGIAAYITEVS